MKTIVKCSNCGGTGWVKQPVKDVEGNVVVDGGGNTMPTLKICPVCNGQPSKEVEEDEVTE